MAFFSIFVFFLLTFKFKHLSVPKRILFNKINNLICASHLCQIRSGTDYLCQMLKIVKSFFTM